MSGRVQEPEGIPSEAEAVSTVHPMHPVLPRRDGAVEAREPSQQPVAIPGDEAALLRAMTASLPVLIAYIGVDQRYRMVNAAYEQWFATSSSSMCGRTVAEVLGAEAYARIAPHLTAALGGATQRFESWLDGEGEKRHVDVTYAPHVSAEGTVQGVVAAITDVSSRKRLEQERASASGRTERLVRITAALAEAVAPGQVYEAVVEQVAQTLGASSAGLFLVREAEATVELVHAVGYGEEGMSALRSVPLGQEPGFPALDTIRTGRPLWFASQQDLVATYPHLQPIVSPGRAYCVACLPITASGRTLGCLGFTFDGSPPLDAEQQGFLLLVARYCAQALERLRMLAQERAQRNLAERAAARADLLSRASRAFAEAGKDSSGVLQVMVELVTDEYADLCGVSLIAGEHLKLEAMHQKDPEVNRLLERALLDAPPKVADSNSGRVISSGQSAYIRSLDPEAVKASAPVAYRAWLERFMPGSVIIAPLRARARIIGTVAAVRRTGATCFAPEDVAFMEALGERAAMAIEGARLYQENLMARQRTELLYGLARTVIEAPDTAPVFQAALDALQQALHASRAAILTFDADDVMRFRAWRGLSDPYRAAVEGHSPWSKDARDPKPIFIGDALSDPSLAELWPVLKRENIGALGFFPLSAAGQLVGKFMVYYDTPRELSQHEIEMAGAIANHVAAAVSRFEAVTSLQQTVKFNEMFTGMLGHDLRNPLGAIMASAQVAIRRAPDERTGKPLSRIITSGQRMARMIDQLLDFTRVRVGRGMPVEPVAVDLVQLLRQVIDELDGALPGRVVQLTHQGQTNGTWDEDRLSQVFSNLIANALQHGADANVHVLVDGGAPESVRVEVHNAGAIPEEVLPHLFEPMTGGESRRHRSDGLGLGLYISHQIIRAHGGSIAVASTPELGTTFAAVLPRGPHLGASPQSEK